MARTWMGGRGGGVMGAIVRAATVLAMLSAALVCAAVPAAAGTAPAGETAGAAIVISLADRRLYLHRADGPVRSFPVAIGRPGVAIPLGDTTVTRKRRNPTWRPTANQRRADPGLPRAVPPGPDNPLGRFALDLGWPAYAIHGTNRPDSIGRRASGGCFRMLPADIETVFATVPVGTPVRVVAGTIGDGAAPPAGPAGAAPEPRPAPIPAAMPRAAPPPERADPAPPAVADPRCGAATAPLHRLRCDDPALATLDGRIRGLARAALAALPAAARADAAIAGRAEDRRFEERIGARCWIRRGSEADPAVAAAARACLHDALADRLSALQRRWGGSAATVPPGTR